MNTPRTDENLQHPHTVTKRVCLASLLFATPLIAAQTIAADLYVDPVAGVDVAGCLAIASPCQSIEYAIAQTVADDVVNLVSIAGIPATYFESGLEISHNLTIAGAGAFNSTIDAQAVDRVFDISGGNVLIKNVTLKNGDAGLNLGGGINLRTGNLIVSRSRILDNVALGGGGIAAHDTAGDVAIIASSIKRNIGNAYGGGIWCESCSSVNVALSAVSANLAGGNGGGLYIENANATIAKSYMKRNNADAGGAVYALQGTTTISGSELSDNEADSSDGGSVYVSGILNVQLSTMASNTAANNGGAVFATESGTVLASNSTFSSNQSLVGGAFGLDPGWFSGPDVIVIASTFYNNESTFPGAAEHIFGGWTSFTMSNSIMTNDPGALVAPDPFCTSGMSGGQHNLIDDASCNAPIATFNLGVVNDFDLNLAFNGGLTRTHQLFAGSNAIEAGRNPACANPATGALLVVDQRGRPRPVDADLNGTATCDIGAFEIQ